MNARMITVGLAMFVTIGMLAGCAETPPPRTITEIVEQGKGPKWLTHMGTAFSGDRAVFYGVGNAAGLINPSLKRKAAEAAARRNIAQEFNTYIAALQKQYLAETTAGSMEAHSVEQHIEDVMKQLTDQTLVGVSIVEYWENPYWNEAYALARLDLARLKDKLEGMASTAEEFKELDSSVRDFIRGNADKLHGELSSELEKKNNGK